ncbi:hypothetical protein [Nocardioides panaciterrulae]|uniref:Uncharacterized protein n=1 Tax=Nocardioides panaciterrulae TaxID=661492 RepID=A0A7Y9E912_9ACTN|nr:hypothetical protein [Nocardioides panaciterrulae]NYD43145.1 hypothetical protein [Nocardioides panaciterrulae]
MSETPYAPVIRSQADLEDAWRHLMEPLGFGGHSLWLMFVQPDGTPLPHLTQIEECVRPPTPPELNSFVALLRSLGSEMCAGERIVFLRSRPGRGGPTPDDLAWARSLYDACRRAEVETDVVHLATDDMLVPLPMDEVMARTA